MPWRTNEAEVVDLNFPRVQKRRKLATAGKVTCETHEEQDGCENYFLLGARLEFGTTTKTG